MSRFALRTTLWGILFLTLSTSYTLAYTMATPQMVVLELYTSQGCSSCPPADALLKSLALSDPSLLPLSFHVHYWDYLGWKDPYSSSANTERQKAYARVLDGQIYTPELIVNGTEGMVGSRRDDVDAAIRRAKNSPAALNVVIAPSGDHLIAHVTRNENVTISGTADILEVHFKTAAMTHVAAGENSDRTLENINNVTSIKQIGTWSDNGKPLTLNLDSMSDDGLAVLVQQPGQGHILGAGSYLKPS